MGETPPQIQTFESEPDDVRDVKEGKVEMLHQEGPICAEVNLSGHSSSSPPPSHTEAPPAGQFSRIVGFISKAADGPANTEMKNAAMIKRPNAILVRHLLPHGYPPRPKRNAGEKSQNIDKDDSKRSDDEQFLKAISLSDVLSASYEMDTRKA
ncbi:MAG: hypothetical protein Q9169_007485 [Polycauliona sp. 2 TL-2023]